MPIQMILTCRHSRIPTLWRLLERKLSTKTPPAASSQDNGLSHTTPTASQDIELPHTKLPTPKMRALISLYHQADSWVTKTNLLQKIDEAFVQSGSLALSAGREENMVSVSDMKNHINGRRTAPKIAQWDTSSSGSDSAVSQWSESGKSKRDLKVLEALYGVTAFEHSSKNISQAFLPGLEVLQDSACSAMRDYKEDREAELRAFAWAEAPNGLQLQQESASSAEQDRKDDRDAENLQDLVAAEAPNVQ